MNIPLLNSRRAFAPPADKVSLVLSVQSGALAHGTVSSNHSSSHGDRDFMEALKARHEEEVLSFLSERPIHTVIMSGLIHDNGLEGPLSRGKFYAYRGPQGVLEGVALIGHATLLEVRSENAHASLAPPATGIPGVHMVLGEQDKIDGFWKSYSALATVA